MTDEDTNIFLPVPASGSATLRCVTVVDADLAPGLAVNAAAVLALSLGARMGDLVGAEPGQQTTDYAQLTERVGQLSASELDCVGVGLCGAGRAVRRLSGALPLLR